MSIIEKKVRGRGYVYFQQYRQAKRYEEYLGPADDPIVWREARQKYKAVLDAQLRTLDDRIAERFGLTDRRRLLEAIKPVAEDRRWLPEAISPKIEVPLQSSPLKLHGTRAVSFSQKRRLRKRKKQ